MSRYYGTEYFKHFRIKLNGKFITIQPLPLKAPIEVSVKHGKDGQEVVVEVKKE